MKRRHTRSKYVSESESSDWSPTNHKDAKIIKRKKKYRYHQKHKFNEFEIRSLIAAVKARPVLWKENYCDSSENEAEAWQSLFEELNFEGLKLQTLKLKWTRIQKTFNQHAEKLVAEAEHGDSAPHQVQWRYFRQMCFLYEGLGKLDTSLIEEYSYINLEPKVEISVSPAPKKTRKSLPSDLIFENHQSNNNLTKQDTQSLSISTSTPSQTHQCVDLHPSTPDTPSRQYQETNRIFCNYLSGELRLLSEDKSCHLRRLLIKKVHDFMDWKSQRDN